MMSHICRCYISSRNWNKICKFISKSTLLKTRLAAVIR